MASTRQARGAARKGSGTAKGSQRIPPSSEIFKTQAGRRAFARADTSFFATYYLGLAYAEHQKRWFDLVRQHRRLLILAPRDHGKTEAICRSYAESRIVEDRNTRVLVVSKTKDVARKRVDQVRQDLAGNQRLIADFGVFSPHSQGERERRRVDGADQATWTRSEFVVAGRTQNLRDPTLEGVGIGGAVTGGHFDLIILDDPIEYTEAQSQAARNAAWNWFLSTILELCEPGTRIVVVATRKHADDLYGRIIDEEPTFAVHTDKAILQWPTSITYVTEKHEEREMVVGVRTSDDYRLLWGEKWSVEDLLLKYRSDSVTFQRENQNELTDDSRSLFRAVYFTGGTLPDKPGLTFPGCFEKDLCLVGENEPWVNLYGYDILQAWDLSLVTSKREADQRDTDYTVGLTVGYDRATKHRVLLSMYRGRGLLPSEILRAIEDEAIRFKAIATGIEVNAFGHLYEIGLRNSTNVRLVPHTTDRRKHDAYEGIPRLVSVLENGRWRIPYADAPSREVGRLVLSEFTGLGVEAHDDIVMACWIMECMLARWEDWLRRQKHTLGRGVDGDDTERDEGGDEDRYDVEADRD